MAYLKGLTKQFKKIGKHYFNNVTIKPKIKPEDNESCFVGYQAEKLNKKLKTKKNCLMGNKKRK